jgi:hypothetical protein
VSLSSLCKSACLLLFTLFLVVLGLQPANAVADTAAPQLVSFDFTPKTVDVSGGAQNVVVTAHVTDATGAKAPVMTVSSDTTSQSAGFGSMALVSGTATDGVYQRTVSIPATAAPGAWTVTLYPLDDTVGNSSGGFRDHPSKLMVTNGPADTAAPQLVSFDFTPKTVDVSGGAQNVVVTAHVTDATGVQAPTAQLSSDVTTETADGGAMTRISGTATDGVYQRTMILGATATPGSWTVKLYPLNDTLGNGDDTFHSHPTKLTVTNAPTGPAAPGVVTGVQAVASDRAATVSWSAAADNGTTITAYEVAAAPSGPSVTVDATHHSTVISGLTNGQSYTFAVRAISAGVTGSTSAPSNTVVPTLVTPQTTISSGPASGSFLLGTAVTFGYSATDSQATFQCTVDGIVRACGTSRVTLSSLSQTTHLFTVAARDLQGDLDSSPARRVWTVPKNNTTLKHSAGWQKASGAGYYLGTYSTTTRKGATLSTGISGARSVALIATRAPGQGTVDAYVGSKLVKRVSLASATVRKEQIIPIVSSARGIPGTLKLVVSSTRKPVKIEGLGVATQ